jgi:hypothetical protein
MCTTSRILSRWVAQLSAITTRQTIRDARGDLRPLQDAHLSGLVVDLLRLVPRHPQEQIAQGFSAFLLWILITLCSAPLSGCVEESIRVRTNEHGESASR